MFYNNTVIVWNPRNIKRQIVGEPRRAKYLAAYDQMLKIKKLFICLGNLKDDQEYQ